LLVLRAAAEQIAERQKTITACSAAVTARGAHLDQLRGKCGETVFRMLRHMESLQMGVTELWWNAEAGCRPRAPVLPPVEPRLLILAPDGCHVHNKLTEMVSMQYCKRRFVEVVYRVSTAWACSGRPGTGNDLSVWEQATLMLRAVLAGGHRGFGEDPGEAALYGLTMDRLVKDCFGKEHQLATLELYSRSLSILIQTIQQPQSIEPARTGLTQLSPFHRRVHVFARRYGNVSEGFAERGMTSLPPATNAGAMASLGRCRSCGL